MIRETVKAVMDRVVQQTASSAEEMASASQELNAQVRELRYNVKKLAEMIGGTDKGRITSRTRISTGLVKANTAQSYKKPSKAIKKLEKESSPSAPEDTAKEATPEDIIPFKDEDF